MKRFLVTLFFSLIFVTDAFAILAYKQEIDISSDTAGARGINFKPDGTIMYVTRRTNDTSSTDGFVNQYSLGTPFDISTAKLSSTTQLSDGTTDLEYPHAIEFKPDGTKMFVVANEGLYVYQYNLTTAWDTSTLEYVTRYEVDDDDESQLRTLTFKPDGKRMFVSGKNQHFLKEYRLDTAWDVSESNVTFVKNSSALSASDNNMRNVQFNSNGTELYLGGNQNNNMNKYTLSTAWDISTISSTFTAYSLGSRFSNMRGFIFTANFTMLFVTDDNNATNRILQYVASCGTTLTCENPENDEDTVVLVQEQVELSKRIIKHNTLPIMHRIEWLRRHKNYDDLNNFQAEISFSDQRLSKLVELIKPNEKSQKNIKKDEEWYKWNEGFIGIGKTGIKNDVLARNIHSTGFAIGADKKKNKDTMYGYVFQLGTDNTDIIPNLSGIFAKSYSISMYGTTLRENHIFTDGIIGISHLELDIKRHKNTNILQGNRNGHQMFGTINFGKRINSEKLNLNPNVKIDLGYTMLDEYREKNEYGTTSDVLFFKNHEILTGFGTLGLLMDETIKHYEDKIINHTGRIEYIIDFSPSSDADFYYVSDPDTKYSLKINGEDEKSFRIGYGFDVTSISGWSVIANFERFQTKGSGYMNEIYLSAGYVPIDGTKFALNLINNNNMKAGFDFAKNINGFDFKFDYENNLNRSNKNNSANFSLHKVY